MRKNAELFVSAVKRAKEVNKATSEALQNEIIKGKRTVRSEIMANSVQRLITDNNFEPGEYIRVVPLHYPKPTISPVTPTPGPIAGVVDLFGDQPVPAVTTAKLTYRNGPLLTNVELFTVFWGTLWGSTSTSTDLMNNLNTFFADIVVSSLIDQLAEYDVPGQAIGHGSFAGTKVISDNAPVGECH